MKTRVDERLRFEAARFALRFTCEACAYFEPDAGRCSHDYPVEAHRAVDLQHREALEFCKEFELV